MKRIVLKEASETEVSISLMNDDTVLKQVVVIDAHTRNAKNKLLANTLIYILRNTVTVTKTPVAIDDGKQLWEYNKDSKSDKEMLIEGFANSDEVSFGIVDDENEAYTTYLVITEGTVEDLEAIFSVPVEELK